MASTELLRLFRMLLPQAPNVTEGKMFGCESAFVNGRLFCGVFREMLLFRLAPADQKAFLDHADTADFEPMPGRKMNGFVVHRHPFDLSEDEIANWMQCALAFVSTLPPGKKQAKKKAKRP